MKILFRLLLCPLLAFSAGCATRQPPTATSVVARSSRPALLLLISIVAYRYDYIECGRSPTLAMPAGTGVQAASMQASFPSLTFPNHYTIVTGLRPDHHGIVHNDVVDPQLGEFSLDNRQTVSDGRWWAEATPIWKTADQHGLRTATMFWPGSEANIHGGYPDEWKPFSMSMPPGQRVDQIRPARRAAGASPPRTSWPTTRIRSASASTAVTMSIRGCRRCSWRTGRRSG